MQVRRIVVARDGVQALSGAVERCADHGGAGDTGEGAREDRFIRGDQLREVIPGEVVAHVEGVAEGADRGVGVIDGLHGGLAEGRGPRDRNFRRLRQG